MSENSVGGRVYSSDGLINQSHFEDYVHAAIDRGEDVKILSGVHGDASGLTEFSEMLLNEDEQAFGNIPGVTIYNTAALSTTELEALVSGPGTTIAAFCWSTNCLATLLTK